MKHLLLTTIAAVLLVGCGESQQSAPAPESKPAEPVAWQVEPIEVLIKTDSGLSDFTFEVLDGPGELGFKPQYWFDRDRFGTKLKLTGVGVVTLVLSEPGDARYAAALVQKQVTVTKAEQTITFEDLASEIAFLTAVSVEEIASKIACA